MGENLFPAFPALTDRASELLGYSIKELCLDPANRNLNLTQYTQPALYVVNALAYLQLKEETGQIPDFVAGHSLGEYNALFAAEALDFETGLRLVQKRGALMAMMKDGSMAAVKGLSEEEIKYVLQRHGLDEIDVANYNSQNQIVLSGPKELINRSGHYFEAAGASLYFVLNVSGAFHSRYMLPARQEFELYLQQFHFQAPRIPVVSNVEAALYHQDKIRSLLADQLIKPVRWTDSVLFLSNQGSITFKEVGPGDVLTKLVFGIQRDRQALVQ
ncbi:ACP S-malonyltransferase [Paraflavitalea speifideaquila]|uniref:ACP S-malonyltransferase n=1 Tax=Paraflavitalea speifideaquila TaxID=3076558 RepID=UPI0028EBAB9C|nr:ACP S-malonyltransferase [Paraflavitalea speifideiaquila]